MTSIRTRLLLWLLLAWSVAGVLGAIIIYRTAQSEANQLFDYHLKQIALTLQDQPFEDQDILGTLEEEADYDFVIQVWDESRVKLYSSHTQASLPQAVTPGFSALDYAERTWRVFLLTQAGLNIQVAQPISVRQNRAAKLALRTVTPFLLVLPVIGVLIWFTVNKGLAPIDYVARAIRQRDHQSLDPITDSDSPIELKPMLSELNDLMQRLRLALEAQRAFTADAAHELRTPLTALQLQAQLAERAKDPEERRKAFGQLRAGLKRGIHLVTQLLTLARSEAGAASRKQMRINLRDLAREVVIEYVNIAQSKQIDLGITRDAEVEVLGDAEGLRAMIGNLIENSIRYTPAGGKVDFALTATDEGPRIEISDTGPGILIEERERVFDRFHRGQGVTQASSPGSGLGLAIVKNVAQRHSAVVTLHDVEGASGLMVRVQFPKEAG